MNSNEVEKELLRRVDRFRDSTVTNIVEKTTKDAQRNFNKFEVNASTDNPRVTVSHSMYETSGDVTSSTVRCVGEQVIFIEFGVGYNNSLVKEAGRSGVGSWGGKSGNEGAIGFEEGGVTEIAPRPAGVVPLGQYGKGLGSDDCWIRPSALGIPNEYAGESYVHKKNGDVRTDVVWTVGHNPARALWTAVRNARKSVMSEVIRLGRKAKPSHYTQLSLFDF